MVRTCSKLGIRLLFAKPYSPEATGKVERFNRVVDSFLAEAALEKPQTLNKLNTLFYVWLDECYQHKAHSALGDKISPEIAYRSDKKPLRFLDPDVISNAFLHCEERKVDKAGCINFVGNKYEVGLSFIGYTVDVVYDPADTSELTIEYKGHAPWTVKKLIIGERTGIRPKLPEHLELKPANSSRLLSGAAQQRGKRKEQQAPAVSYRAVNEEAERRV